MRYGLTTMVATVLLLLSAGTGRAEVGVAEGGGADDVAAGRELYRRLCASCHGVSGRGDGPVARALGEPPTDLTVFARDNGGNFPALEVFDAIEGSEMPRAHGVSEMPVWGEVLLDTPSSYATIDLITSYIRSIQRK